MSACQYDLRAAERARDRLQGSEISGRPVSSLLFKPIYVVHLELQIDVHYSLPRDDNLAKGGDKNQVWKSFVYLALVLKPMYA